MNMKKVRDSRSRKEIFAARVTLLTLLTCLFIATCPIAYASDPTVWSLVWSHEFGGPNGSAVDSSKLFFDIGGNGWGNNELETYTSRTTNAYRDGGVLVIKALRETLKGSDGITRDYTSARLLTKNKFSQAYGRFEARI